MSETGTGNVKVTHREREGEGFPVVGREALGAARVRRKGAHTGALSRVFCCSETCHERDKIGGVRGWGNLSRSKTQGPLFHQATRPQP